MDEVAQVRRFNRTVTQRVGALQDRFLGRARPLGEARLLWEIGTAGRDLRSLRADLGLDSGYLSRLLRSLESAGLVTVTTSPSDRRVRLAQLTPAGRAEVKALDKRSDEVAESLLQPLSESQRARLVAAMSQVELLLRGAMITLAEVDPDTPDAQFCLTAYFAELDARFEAGFAVEHSQPASLGEQRPPAGVLLVARLGVTPVGAAAAVYRAKRVCEIKRMWVAPQVRGMGLGRRLLGELETRAVAHGGRVLRLETNRSLVEAISLYRSAGFVEVPRFSEESYAEHWFEKRI